MPVLERKNRPPTHRLQRLVIMLGVLIAVVSLYLSASANGSGKSSGVSRVALSDLPEDPPSYLPWATSVLPIVTPSPYVGIGGAWGAGNIYNTGINAFEYQPPGTGILDTGLCYFACFGSPGAPSHHYLAYGNDVNTPHPGSTGISYTHHGAADDCPGECPGGISNQAFGVTVMVSPLPVTNDGFFVAVDGNGNFGVITNLFAGSTIIAGAGDGSPNPVPSYSQGSLVSYTGAGQGDVLLGSASNYAKCDYGETTASTLTCNAPLYIGGPLISAVSLNATPGPVGPCYGADGSSCTDTFHIVKNASALNITPNGGCANDSWCALNNASISFTGANAEFANDKYTCILSSTSSYLINLTADSQAPSGFKIQAYNSSGSPIANDTTLGITYACYGV